MLHCTLSLLLLLVLQVYDGLLSGMGIHTMLNRWLSMSFRTVDGCGAVTSWSSFQPYQTLLLPEDEAKVLL
jgi:hypothetical protein